MKTSSMILSFYKSRKCINFRQLTIYLLFFVFLVTTKVSAQEPFCVDFFFNNPSKAELIQDLNTNDITNSNFKLWQAFVDTLSTPQQYHDFLKELSELAKQRFTPEDKKYHVPGDSRGDVGVVFRLQQIDFVSPVIKFRDQMTSLQKNLILDTFKKIHENALDQSADSHHRWTALEDILKLALMPETLSDFITGTSSTVDFSKTEFNFAFGVSARIALSSIPESIKKISFSSLSTELQKEFNKKTVGAEKLRRRNLEAIHYYLNAKTLIHKLRQFDHQNNLSKELVEWIDLYWAPLMVAPLPPSHLKYSFHKVLEIAKIIQSGMKSQIEESYIDLYGSFPNMKADSKSSDIDIHFGDSLMIKYIKAMRKNKSSSDEEKHQRDHLQDPDVESALIQDLKKTELAIAQNLNRLHYQESELLTIVPVEPKGINKFFDPRKFQFYNPLKIRIYKNEIRLFAYDHFSGKMLEMTLGSLSD